MVEIYEILFFFPLIVCLLIYIRLYSIRTSRMRAQTHGPHALHVGPTAYGAAGPEPASGHFDRPHSLWGGGVRLKAGGVFRLKA